jgi:hypothetical protein
MILFHLFYYNHDRQQRYLVTIFIIFVHIILQGFQARTFKMKTKKLFVKFTTVRVKISSYTYAI